MLIPCLDVNSTPRLRPTRRFSLLWNFRRNNRRHVYLVIGDCDQVGQILRHFQSAFKITGTLVNVTPESTTARITDAVAKYGCCIFYIQADLPCTMRDVRALVEQNGYPKVLLETINKVYRFNHPSDIYALAA